MLLLQLHSKSCIHMMHQEHMVHQVLVQLPTLEQLGLYKLASV